MARSRPPFHVRMSRGNTASGRSLWEQGRQGMNQVVSNLDKFIKWVTDDVTPEVMQEALEPTMQLSDYYAPKDTHTMVNSRYNDIQRRKGVVRVEVGYNKRGEAPYTVFVHEMPHFYHDPPTQYKFLQRALDEDTTEIAGRVATGIRRRTGT